MNKTRKPPTCLLCKYHGISVKKAKHKNCPYELCTCILCETAKSKRAAGAEEQQKWRKIKKNVNYVAEPGVKYCDMCRNHGKLVRERYHRPCPHINCDGKTCGNKCRLTIFRRKSTSVTLKLERKKLTSKNIELVKKSEEESPSSGKA